MSWGVLVSDSAIILHRVPNGHVSKTGYVKLSTFSQIEFLNQEMTDCYSGDGKHSS
ncbi:Peptidase S41 family protein [Perilla frutescens var. frutescens]|nr:Peptidase S41 family protein [Perilla frutescens var. frutescens]